jgi:hypothetical protein
MSLDEEQPPIGIMPARIWKEQRIDALLGAIGRYVDARKFGAIGLWCDEIKQLAKELSDEEKQTKEIDA